MRKALSLLLSIAMVISMCNGMVITAFADGGSIATEVQGTYTKSDEAQDITIRFVISDLTSAYCGFTIEGVTLPSGFSVKSYSTSHTQAITAGDYSTSSGKLTYMTTDTEDTIPADTYYELVVTAPAGASGEYDIEFTDVKVSSLYGSVDLIAASKLTAKLTISEATTTADDYEIYYTLDDTHATYVTRDADGDGYFDYSVSDTVAAEIFVKNNTGSDVILQAYDIFLTYDNSLEYKEHTLTSGNAYSSNDKLVHVQAVGEDGSTTDPIAVSLPNGTAVSLGTINFTILSTAEYDTGMDIKLTVGTGANVTNIGVGTAGSGDPASYYPVNTSEVYGPEILTTYTVTYDANGGTWGDGVAAPTQDKFHNVDLTLNATTPTREGYEFTGWLGSDNTTYQVGDSYATNAALTLTAQWEQNVFKVYWYNTAGTEIYSADVNSGATTSFDETTYTKPSKDADAQYTYTFKGWSTDSSPELDAEVVDLSTYTITAETKFYPVFSTTTNTYTVIWNNWDNSLLEKDEKVPYGTTPTYDGSTPTKASTDQYEYTFKEWTPAVSAITGETTYTATYTESTRSYDIQFAAGTNGTLTNGDKQTVAYGSTLTTIPTVTANNGYSFTGWSDGDTTYKTDLSDYTVTGAVTLTAQYGLVEYTITLDVNGGDALTSSTISYKITDTVTLPTATKTGATFDGWKLDTAVDGWEAKTYTAGDYTDKYGTVTLVAQWTNKTFVIKTDSVTGGTVSPSVNSANYGDTITLTNTPADGYQFLSYSVTAESGELVNVSNDGTFTMPASNVIVSARFSAIPYTVTVDSDKISNGTVAADATTAYVNQTVTLTPTANAGYKWASYTVTADSGDAVTVTDNKFTMPADNVTVTATFTGIQYTVVFNKNADEATGTVNNITATFGQSIQLTDAVYSRTGYTFLGWSASKTATEATYAAGSTITADLLTPTAEGESTTLYAVWEAIPYTVTVDSANINNGAVTADKSTATVGQTVTLSNNPADGYQLESYTVVDVNNAEVPVTDGKFTMPASNVTVTATFTAIPYDVTVDSASISNGTVTADKDTATVGQTVTLSNNPADGYELVGYTVKDASGNSVEVSDGKFTMPASKVTVTATFKATTYTITFDTNGGTAIASVEYTIESEYTLPTATGNGLYTFDNWLVTTAGGSWKKDAEIEENTSVKGSYGNVTLTAQWDIGFTYKVETYKYAKTDYVMLRIATSGNTNAYSFDGEKMFYTDDENYKLGSSYVFVTLIPSSYVSNGKLTEAGMNKIAQTTEAAPLIARDGDINGDGVVNIADANVVYQMTVNGGSYYGNLDNGNDQSDILSRLEADMNTATTSGTNEYRGSIEDVQAIVDIINRAAITTT